MKRLTRKQQQILGCVFAVLLFTQVILWFVPRQEIVRIVYVIGSTDSYDKAAFQNLQQSSIVNVNVEMKALGDLPLRKMSSYDAVMLDPSLHNTAELKQRKDELQQYVSRGGRLFLENALLDDFPLEFLGAAALKNVIAEESPSFTYPEVPDNVRGIQKTIQLFSENFFQHAGMKEMPGFQWGKGIVPSTARTIVAMGDTSLYTLNAVGKGTVFCSSTFLPNKYFITGLDLKSGMDPSAGFEERLKQQKTAAVGSGVAYFDFKTSLSQQPYFQFSFAAANQLLRNEYVAYVSKEKLGYSMKKVMGPYGRPAMAYQNHFEAISAIRDREGIQWAELLKQYNQIPSFSLIRSSFEWYQWKESIVAHLNTGSEREPEFLGEQANSFYGSGVHLSSGDQLLSLATYPQKVELAKPINLPYRAYPTFVDLNGDGKKDLISGSADGFLYYFENVGPKASNQVVPEGVSLPDAFSNPSKLLTTSGEPLKVESYSTVTAIDLNGDGLSDLVLGSGNGGVFYSLNKGLGKFTVPAPLYTGSVAIHVSSYAAPVLGDIDQDGVPDLLIGDGDGGISLFRGIRGQPLRFRPPETLFHIPAKFAAPTLKDMNDDGKLDLVIGNSEGDVQVYLNRGSEWEAKGPIEGTHDNMMGNKALVAGHNSVPIWTDINHDGRDDLLVGQLEYGLSYNIDDPKFPYKKQLEELIQYAKKNKLEIYPHVLVHNYKSKEEEQEELQLHKQAFEILGIPWGNTGANQHTWRINNTDRLQTLQEENAAGLWFNFGFRPSYAPSDPQYGEDYLWGIPFRLESTTLQKPMLLFTPAPFLRRTGPYANLDIYNSFVQQDMPIDYFEHVEYRFPNENRPSRVDELLDFVTYFDELRTKEDYNFMTEPQMARSLLAQMDGKISVSRTWGMYWLDHIKDWLGKGKHLKLNVAADTSGISDLAKEYKDSLGVAVELGERYVGSPLVTNSDIFTRKDQKLYIGLNHAKTDVAIGWEKDPMHIVRANVPVRITKEKNKWLIDLESEGMQQIKMYSPVALRIQGENIKLDSSKEEGTFVVTHYGDKASIVVSIGNDS